MAAAEGTDVKKGGCCSSRMKLDVSRDDSIKQKMTSYCENSYMHGPAGIVRSKNLIRMSIWILMFCGGWGMTIWMLRDLVIKYYKYETTTSVTLNSNATMLFPAVTICNINPMRSSQLSSTSSATLKSLIENAETSRTPLVSKWSDQTANASFFSDWDSDVQTELDFEYNYASLSTAEKQAVGHELETMLIACRFKGVQCGPVNFTTFVNYKYGNCYTFNSGLSNPVLSTQKTGPLYGLTLELFIEHDEYIGSLANDAGVRLVVHNQSMMPFPEDEGVSLSPGTRSAVTLSMLSIIRAEPKYGDCKEYTEQENLQYNAWSDLTTLKLGYSLTACQKTCLQQSLISRCGCCNSNYPCNGTALNSYITAQGGSVGYCLYSDTTQSDCVDDVTAKFESGELNCDQCKSPCDETEYKTESSSSMWPSNAYLDDAITDFASSSDELYANLTRLNTAAEKRGWIEENGIKLDIYFKYLNYEKMETTPSYVVSDLLSDVGGQLGLWVGLSVVSTFEVFELLGDVIAIMFLRCRRNQQVGDTEKEPTKDGGKMEIIDLDNNKNTDTFFNYNSKPAII